MSAVVCGKRSSIFGDDLVASPSSPPSPSHHHHPAKRARCSPSRRREVLLHHHLLSLSLSLGHLESNIDHTWLPVPSDAVQDRARGVPRLLRLRPREGDVSVLQRPIGAIRCRPLETVVAAMLVPCGFTNAKCKEQGPLRRREEARAHEAAYWLLPPRACRARSRAAPTRAFSSATTSATRTVLGATTRAPQSASSGRQR